MHWVAPSQQDNGQATLEKRLWDSADQFRANSGLKAQEYSGPILGIIFLRFAEVRFAAQRAGLEKASASSRRGSRMDEPAAYHAEGILYLAPNARFDFLLRLPEATDIGAKINDAMRAGVLPKTYNLFTSTLLKELLKKIPKDKAPKYLLQPGDIVVARTGATTGYAKHLNKQHPETVFASYLVRVRASAGVSNRMLGILMESDDYKQFIKTNIGGAAQPQANAVVLTSVRVAAPPAPFTEKFDRLVEPILDEAELLALRIQNLRRTRDLLLPRLLSGQLELAMN